MNLESFECPICQNIYDDKSHTPRILRKCGHTLCSECLGKILQSSSRQCPLDKKKFGRTSTTIERFHKNFALLGILAERNTIKVCSEHQMKLKYTCLEDGSKICPECALHGAHKGHEAKLTKTLKMEHRERRKKLTKLSEDQSLNKKRQLNALQSKEQEMVKNIKEGFSVLKEILQDKELEMIYGAKLLINSERKAIFLGSREERNLNDEIQKGIKEIESFEKTENYLSIKDKDFDGLAAKSESNLLQKVSNERITRLEQVSKTAKMETLKHQHQLAQLNAFTRSTLDEIYQHFKTQECQELFSKVDLLSSKVLEIPSRLNLLQLEDTLFISFIKKRPEILDINPIQWEQIKRLDFDFSEGNILDEDLSILASIRFQFAELTALKMKFNSAKAEQKNLGILLRSMPIFFKQIEKLLELEINLEDCKANERSLVHFMNNFVAKALNLKRLKINLDSTLITDFGVQSLLAALQNLNRLESIWLNLFDTKVSDQAFDNIHILVKTPSKLHLNLQGTQITDKTLMYLAEEFQLTINTITRLSLNFAETLISDEGVCSLTKYLKELNHFELNIMDTKVQDKGASEICGYIQKNVSSLEFYSIRLEGTNISEKYRFDLEFVNAY